MDIRSIKTRQKIARCFLERLKEKPISKISVTELCRMARINRATFYKHYLDIRDLQESLEQEVLEHIKELLQLRSFPDNGAYRAMLIELLNNSRRFGDSFYPLCSPNAASDLAARIFQLLDALTFPLLKQQFPAMDEQKAKMVYQYITYGNSSVLSGWLSGGISMSAEELADFIMLSSCALVEAAIAGEKRTETDPLCAAERAKPL